MFKFTGSYIINQFIKLGEITTLTQRFFISIFSTHKLLSNINALINPPIISNGPSIKIAELK